MENYENNPIPQEAENQTPRPAEPVAQEQTPPVSEPYSGAGVGRKESPFADSPYVMNHRQAEYRPQNEYVPPQPPVKPKKPRNGKVWKRTLGIVLALAVVALGLNLSIRRP